MKKLFDQLQLRPHERRLVVIGMVVLFLVLNMWFVWPHYGDRARAIRQLTQSNQSVSRFQKELSLTNQYNELLTKLDNEGAGVLSDDEDIALLSTVQTLIRENGVSHSSITPAARSALRGTNEFFEQRALTIVLNPNEPQPLISFLVSLATNDVTLRVDSLELKPDQSKTKLSGSLRVVASFQKKRFAPASSTNATPKQPAS
jgi:hypothetical protein